MVNARNLGNVTTQKKKENFLRAEKSGSANLFKMLFIGENLK